MLVLCKMNDSTYLFLCSSVMCSLQLTEVEHVILALETYTFIRLLVSIVELNIFLSNASIF